MNGSQSILDLYHETMQPRNRGLDSTPNDLL